MIMRHGESRANLSLQRRVQRWQDDNEAMVELEQKQIFGKELEDSGNASSNPLGQFQNPLKDILIGDGYPYLYNPYDFLIKFPF